MGPPPGDSWSADIAEALNKQAATHRRCYRRAVVAKAAKEREAVKRMAAEEKREEMVTVLGAPAAKRQAGVKCDHGRRRYECVECGGSGICEHGRVRYSCKDCVGASICEHGRVRSVCKDCGGGSRCEHGRVRRFCKDCCGSGLCQQHLRRRDRCTKCRCARDEADKAAKTESLYFHQKRKGKVLPSLGLTRWRRPDARRKVGDADGREPSTTKQAASTYNKVMHL